MIGITYITTKEELNKLKDLCFEEVILAPRALSRLGILSLDETHQLAIFAKQEGLKVFLEWDILLPERLFESVLREFQEFDLSLFDGIRVQDPGVFHYLVNNESCPLHLILETGNHNLEGIKKWVQLGNGRVERLILSNEIPSERLKVYSAELPLPIEMQIFGPLLIFYTPRGLLSPVIDYSKNEDLLAFGESEESPHKGFPIKENRHGTFMFYTKDLCLLDKLDQAQEIINYGRVDLRDRDFSWLRKVSQLMTQFQKEDFVNFKADYPTPLTRGFFGANKTDALFTKLVNHHLQEEHFEENILGTVLEAKRDHYIVVSLENTKYRLKVGDEVEYAHPEGFFVKSKITTIKNTRNQNLDYAEPGMIVLLNHTRKVVTKSKLLLPK